MNQLDNQQIYYKEKTVSTMEDARQALDKGWASHGMVFAAGYQEAGRGRVAGRQWESRPGENLLMTFLLEAGRMKTSLPLPIMTGWGLSLFLKKTIGIDTVIKWPNDLLAGDSKISGILCESMQGWFLAGIGINVNQTGFQGEYRRPVSSLALLAGHKFDINAVLESFHAFFIDFLQNPPESELFYDSLYKKGEEVGVILGDPESGETINGIISGVAADGALQLVKENGEIQLVYSGEILY